MTSSEKEVITIPESPFFSDLPSFGSKTPQKRPHRLRRDGFPKCKVNLVIEGVAEAKKSTKLPDKYEMLARFFDSLDSSYRLLRMKGSVSNFTNISKKIECLTDRRFSYGHLAQMKYIFPEVIEMKKVLVFDENTKCMKPDLHISLDSDALGSSASNLSMRKVFRNRLCDFYVAHPEGDDIPEEELPEPFRRSKYYEYPELISGPVRVSLPANNGDPETEEYTAVDATHLPLSFKRHFSKQLPCYTVERLLKNIRSVEETDFVPCPFISMESNPEKITHMPKFEGCVQFTSKEVFPMPKFDDCFQSTPEEVSPPILKFEDCVQSTPEKASPMLKFEDCAVHKYTSFGSPTSTPKLMSVTPVNKPPKRRCSSPCWFGDRSESKFVRRSLTRNFDFPAEDEMARKASTAECDLHDVLSESLLQSIRGKEEKILREAIPTVLESKRRQQIIANLPKFFDMLHFLFQSKNCSVLDKDDALHNLIVNSADILDRREMEEQLKLLQELEPKWIQEKLTASGNLLLCINKGCSPKSIRERLVEAE